MKRHIIGIVILVFTSALLFTFKKSFENYKCDSHLNYKSLYFNGLSFNYPDSWSVFEKLTYENASDGFQITLQSSSTDCSLTISCLKKFYSKNPAESVEFYLKVLDEIHSDFSHDPIYNTDFNGETAASTNFTGYIGDRQYFGISTSFIKSNVSVSVHRIAANDIELLNSKEFQLIEQSINIR